MKSGSRKEYIFHVKAIPSWIFSLLFPSDPTYFDLLNFVTVAFCLSPREWKTQHYAKEKRYRDVEEDLLFFST